MKSRILSILIATTIMLSACGSQTTTVDLTEKPSEISSEIAQIESMVAKTTEESNALFDKDVDIVLSAFLQDETIDEYVDRINSEDVNKNAKVYDDSHYLITIKESDRVKFLKELESNAALEDAFKEIFFDEQYSCLKSVEYNDDYTEFTFYSNKEEYDNAGLFVVLAPVLISCLMSDSLQAYNLVPPEDRHCTVKIIDSDTKEVLYNSNEEQ